MTSLKWFSLNGTGDVLSFTGNYNVIGDINFTGNLYQNGSLVGTGGGGGSSQWTSIFGSGIYYNGPTVGIGKTNPSSSYKLDVGGDINFNGNIYKNGVLFTGGGGTALWSENAGELYTLTNVGLGTDNPANTLHVSNTSSSFDSSKGIRLGVGNSYATFNYITPVSGTEYLLIQSTKQGTGNDRNIALNPLGGFVGVGKTDPQYILDVFGDVNFTGDIYKNGTLFTAGGSGSWSSYGPDIYYDAGNVGIGTIPSAIYTLQVDGKLNFASASNTINIGGSEVLSQDTLGSTVVNSSLTSVGNLTDLIVDTDTLVVDDSTHRVGIGKTDPQYALDVVGVVNSTGGFFANGTAIIAETSPGVYSLGPTITGSSLTSLGTLTSLNLNGNLNLQAGSQINVGATTVLSDTTLGTTVVNSSLTQVGTLGSLTVSGNVGVATDVFYVDSTAGNVGIGTATPSSSAKLEVNGPIKAPGVHRVTTIDLTSLNVNTFYPVVFDDAPAEFTHHFTIEKDAEADAQPYNMQSIQGMARGGGWSDQLTFYDIYNSYYDTTERSILGIYRGNQSFSGIVIYLRGGANGLYYVVSNSGFVQSYTTPVTVGDPGTTSTFALKNSSGADVSGTSSLITLMWNGITANQGRNISGNIDFAGSLYQNGVLFSSGSSQWTTTGSDIYYTTGRVGIGTNAVGIGTTYAPPKLEVAGGNIRITDLNGAGAGWPLIDTQLGGVEFMMQDSGTVNTPKITYRINQVSYDNNGNARLDMYSSDKNSVTLQSTPTITLLHGSVGIGTTNPAHTFQVRDNNTTIQTGFFDCQNNSNGVLVRHANNTLNRNAFAVQTGSSVDTLIVRCDNRVGVGTANPQTKLHVRGSGDTRISADDSTARWSFAVGHAGVAGDCAIVEDGVQTPFYIKKSTGRIGIGRTDPEYPLDIASYALKNFTGIVNAWFDYTRGGAVLGSNTAVDWNTSLRTAGTIWSQNGFIASSSDVRIKKNIQDVNDAEALEKLREIGVYSYNYKDVMTKGNDKVYGFMAQDVYQKFSHAVSFEKSFIPDIYTACSIDLTQRRITFNTSCARDGKLKVYTTKKEVNIDVIKVEENTVEYDPEVTLSEEEVTEERLIFVYGYEVEDFHVLNKDALFTINFAATQELDRIVESQKQKIASLEAQVANQNSIIQDVQTENEGLTSKLAALEGQFTNLLAQLASQGIVIN